MGKIIVYSYPGCVHCAAAKKILIENQIPFYVIDLYHYPNKRQEMAKLTKGKKNVPQIFFNGNYVGGVQELSSLVESNTLKSSAIKALESEDAEAPHLPPEVQLEDISVLPSATSSVSLTSRTSTLLENVSMASLSSPSSCSTSSSSCSITSILQSRREEATLLERLDNLVYKLRTSSTPFHSKGHWRKLKLYRDSFEGKELVNYLLRNQLSFGQPLMVATQLFKNGYIRCLTRKLQKFTPDSHLYRWIADENPNILNMQRLWSREARSAAEVSADLQTQMMHLEERSLISLNGVDYHAIARSDDFKKYARTAIELQAVDISTLSRDEILSFFINLYNSLVIHATIVLGTPRTRLERASFF